MQTSFYLRYGKRCFDAIAALAGLVVLSPVLLVVAVVVRLEGNGPVFFRQERTGREGKSFRILKFRSMSVAPTRDASLLTAAGDSRVTRVGRFLRKTKLDEIPQLLNVLSGDMSLVGPRPEVPRYTRLYTETQRRVLQFRPGVTSPAALACINEEEILAGQDDPETYYIRVLLPAKLRLDLAYCAKMNWLSDVSLIVRTLLRAPGAHRLQENETSKLPVDAQELSRCQRTLAE